MMPNGATAAAAMAAAAAAPAQQGDGTLCGSGRLSCDCGEIKLRGSHEDCVCVSVCEI